MIAIIAAQASTGVLKWIGIGLGTHHPDQVAHEVFVRRLPFGDP